jgi:tRNA U55 pseudouridine synthase TruB
MAEALADLPTLALDEATAKDVRDGKVKTIEQLQAPADGHIRLLRADGSLLAVAWGEAGRLRLERVFS